MATCRECRTDFEQPPGRSRPRVYCSVGCKRAREYAVKRTASLLETFEERLSWARINGGRAPEVKRFEDEVHRHEQRLRELLNDSEEVPS